MRKRPIGFFLVVGGIALTTGVVLSMVRTAGGSPTGDPSAVESALLLPPTTIAATPASGDGPVATTTLDSNSSAPDSPDSSPPTSTTVPPTPSQAVASVQVRSGTEALRSDQRPQPVGLAIPAIDVSAPVDPYGVAASGQMDVPDNVTDVGWYEFGPSPGEAGSAVLAAHVDLASQGPGVFFDLEDLEVGDHITITYDDDSAADFRVVAGTVYDKDELPLDAIFSRNGPPVLTLITCGGGFSESLRSYDSNVVVYAVPVSAAHTGLDAAK